MYNLMLNLVVCKFTARLQKVKTCTCELTKSTGSNRKRAIENQKNNHNTQKIEPGTLRKLKP